MKLGLLTAPFEDADLRDVASWAGSNGFSAFEVACWPASGGEKRRYAGTSHINVDGLSAAEGGEIKSKLADHRIEISGLGYYPNPLHADADHRDAVIAHLMKGTSIFDCFRDHEASDASLSASECVSYQVVTSDLMMRCPFQDRFS